uniref:Uncharacterized protein n=1 Tax=Caenorhabditis japonica TaxID=281687 RepID=A0A8R1I7U0_CAEJA
MGKHLIGDGDQELNLCTILVACIFVQANNLHVKMPIPRNNIEQLLNYKSVLCGKLHDAELMTSSVRPTSEELEILQKLPTLPSLSPADMVKGR